MTEYQVNIHGNFKLFLTVSNHPLHFRLVFEDGGQVTFDHSPGATDKYVRSIEVDPTLNSVEKPENHFRVSPQQAGARGGGGEDLLEFEGPGGSMIFE